MTNPDIPSSGGIFFTGRDLMLFLVCVAVGPVFSIAFAILPGIVVSWLSAGLVGSPAASPPSDAYSSSLDIAFALALLPMVYLVGIVPAVVYGVANIIAAHLTARSLPRLLAAPVIGAIAGALVLVAREPGSVLVWPPNEVIWATLAGTAMASLLCVAIAEAVRRLSSAQAPTFFGGPGE